MKKVLAKIDCSPYPVHVWFTNSEMLHQQQTARIREEQCDVSGCLGMVSSNESRSHMVIGVFAADRSVLIHEISHAVINIFQAIGMEINNWTTEGFAYMVEHLYRQCDIHMQNWGMYVEE